MLLARITALPWTRVPVTATDDAHGHGRVERRTLKVLTAAPGGFPYAKQIIQITRERVTVPQVMASLRNTVLNMHRLTGAEG